MATATQPFSTGTDSPVRADSSTWKFFVSNSRRSAGTRSPEASSTTSPGTRRSASSAWRWPSRRTRACSESMSRMASSALAALPSWTKPISALTTTARRITALSTQKPSSAVTSEANSIMYSRTLWNCRSKRSSGPWRFGAGNRL